MSISTSPSATASLRTSRATAPADRATSDFTALAKIVHESGLMERRYGYYWTKLVAAVMLVAAWVVGFVQLGDTWWQLLNAVVFSVLVTQIAFLGHDAAHRQIFRSGKWNDWVSLIVANLLVGISYGWWQSKHTRHHAAPNQEGADPDIDFDALAFTPERANRHTNPVLKWLVARQGWYFFPLLLLEGLSLHKDAVVRVLNRGKLKRRWVEVTFLAVRFGGLVTVVLLVLPLDKALVFMAVQLGVFGLYMGSSFAPNHIGMPIVSAKLKLDFLRRQVLMSRNISGGRPIAILMGGLNYQIEHHLFPSMPRPNLRRVQPLVAAHCAAMKVQYTQTTLFESYGIVVRYLNNVGLKGSDPFLCPLVATRRAIS